MKYRNKITGNIVVINSIVSLGENWEVVEDLPLTIDEVEKPKRKPRKKKEESNG